jgi:hypothetical protein
MLTLIGDSLVRLQRQRRREPRSGMRILSLIFGLLLLMSGSPESNAQTTGSATLRGSVKDPAGAVVTNATVVLINEATKIERRASSNQDGLFVFSAVNPAVYTIKIESPGFKTLEQTGLALSSNDTRGMDFVLEIGAPTETVTVSAATETLQTETGAKENTITAKQIENLSIISRGSLELLRILPGVVAPNTSALESVSFQGGSNANDQYNVNGMRGQNITVAIDGARMMDIGANNGTIITANPDMVQEVKVQTSNYAAEHGSSSVMVHATTKSGTSGFHGSLYDYSRDYRLGANDRSNTINGIERPASKYNYPGGNIGGPLNLPRKIFGPLAETRDKLFFFAGFEYYYQRVDEGSTLGVVPSLKMRQGDFSEVGTPLDVPSGCNAPGYVPGQPAPNNSLAPCMDPTGLGNTLLNLYPQPNFSDPTGGNNNYVYSVLRRNDRNQFSSRFDYNISDRTKIYVRLAREYEEQGYPKGLWWNSSNYELPGDLASKNLGRSVVVNLTNIISPTMTNEVLFGASKLKLNYDFNDPDKVSYAALGVQRSGLFPNTNPYLPLGVTTGGEGDLRTAYGFPILAWNDSFTITDNLTKVYKSHALKFGMFIEQANKRQQSNLDYQIELAQWGQNGGTGYNFGDLYTGHPLQVTTGTDRPLDNFRYYNYEFYAQDSWKVRSNFTLEYGLRVAFLPNNFERKGLGILFDPRAYDPSQGLFIDGDPSRPNGILRAATSEIPKGVLDNPPPAFMPRLNFAWDVGGKGDLVVRAGAGLFYNRVQGNYDYYSSGVMPNSYRSRINAFSDNINGITFAGLNAINPFSNIASVDVNSRDPNSNHIPRVANMSLTIEKKLPMNNIFTVAYVGTQGRHLPQQKQINFAPLGAMTSGLIVPTAQQVLSSEGGAACSDPGSAACQQLIVERTSNLANPAHRAALDDVAARQFRPYSNYNTIGYYQFTGTSSYHSLQTTLSRQTGKFSYFATYTYSKALGTTAVMETDGSAWADPIDTRGRSWGVLPFDRTHIFYLSYNYYLPDVARGALNNRLTRGLFNGWQISGITTFQSGTPMRIRFGRDGDSLGSGDMARAYFGTDAYNNDGNTNAGAITPIYLRNPSVSNEGKVGDALIDINALAIPAFGTSGPAQVPFYFRYPSRSNFDVTVFKNFKISESKSFQFRAGFFNLFNQAYPTMIDINNPGASDIYLRLDTQCSADSMTTVPNGVGGTDEVCNPQGPFTFTSDTINNFGRITNKRGRRIVELALKFYF